MAKGTAISGDTWRRSAEIVYPQLKEWEKSARELHTSYSKWLITTAYAIHAGAIAGLVFNAGGQLPAYLPSVRWFVAGLLIALIAGFAAWINLSALEELYRQWANPNMLITPGKETWPKEATELSTDWPIKCSLDNWIKYSLLCSIGAGIVSWLCILFGAISVARHL